MFNLFKPKSTLIEYFLTNKFTFPVITINKNSLVFSHGNTNDIDTLFKLFPKLSVKRINHKRYDHIFLLQLKNQFALIVDEYCCDDNNIINTLIDIKNSQMNDWLKYSKDDNIIYPIFGTK